MSQRLRIFLIASLIYKDTVNPITVSSVANFVYFGGALNSIDDIKNRRKKPIYVNLLEIAKYSTFGVVCGIFFPITIPLIVVNATYNKN